MRYPLLSTVTRASTTGERTRARRNPLTPTERERIRGEADHAGRAAGAAFQRRDYATGHFMQGRGYGLRRAVMLTDPALDNPRRRRGRRNPVGLTRVRVIPSHSGLARFLAQVEGPIGSVPRQVRTPYASAPTHVVWSWRGVPVIVAETRHRHYEVFRVEGPIGPVEEANPRRRRGGRNPYTEVHADGDRVAYWRDPRRTQVTVISRDTRPDRNPRRPVDPASKLETLRRIVAQHQAMRIGPEGSVDAFTASAILAVYDALSPENQAKYLAMPVRRMAAVAWKVVGPKRNPRRRRPAAGARLTKIALRRAPGYPVGVPAPLELRCPCGEVLAVPASGHITCPRCGAIYDAQGWIIRPSSGSNPRRRRRAGGRGRYCSERLAATRAFDRRSFRTVAARGHRVTVGCPRGQYDARRRRCRTATRAQRILHPAGEGRCPIGERELGNPARASRTTTRTTTTRVSVRRNPPAGPVCALCRIRPRAPLSTFCKACLATIARGPQRNPYLVRAPHADVLYRSARAAERHARRRRPPLAVYKVSAREAQRRAAREGRRLERRNPPRGGVVIYDRVVELRAVKGGRSQFPRESFKHRFTSRAQVIGLPDGSVLLKGPKPLWSRVEVK